MVYGTWFIRYIQTFSHLVLRGFYAKRILWADFCGMIIGGIVIADKKRSLVKLFHKMRYSVLKLAEDDPQRRSVTHDYDW